MYCALLYIVSALLIAGFAAATSEPHAPEVTETKKIDQEAKKAMDAVSQEIKVRAKVSNSTVLNPVSYAKEKDYLGVVYPVYIVKIRLGAGQPERYVHAQIYHGIFDGKYYLERVKDAHREDPFAYIF
ncbi:uncharacterized protein LOC129601599 [Paramacrobiotus metropolitanus]|uniref:uncharacterized protein LOC129601599 n=1 Tax=Paramacrobiotus metropolitanus TaxID=2943436 RepID=UPI002446136A|nr:uncharacterized protein LOC129601599 [Paramacrobiotus metropolitanus]